MKIFHQYTLHLYVLALLCLPFSVFAEKAAVKAPTVTVYDRAVDLFEVPATYTGTYQEIDNETINQTQSTLADVLSRTQGLQVKQTGGIGSYSTLSIRGSTTNQVDVYLDGQLISNKSDGNFNAASIDPSLIERIQVFYGPPPAYLSQNNIGGAINIITKRASHSHVSGKVTRGSFSTEKYNLSIHDVTDDRHEFNAILNHLYSKNNFEYENTYYTPGRPSKQERQNDQISQSNALINGKFQLNNEHTLGYRWKYLKRDKGIPERVNRETNEKNVKTYQNNFAFHLQSQVTASTSNVANITTNNRWEHYINPRIPARLSSNYTFDERTFTLENRTSHYLASHTLTGSIHFSQTDYEALYNTYNADNQESMRQQINFIFADDYAFSNIYTNLAYRPIFVNDDNLATTPNGTQTKTQRDYVGHDYNVGIGLQHRTHNFSLNFSQSSRIPTMSELYANYGNFRGNDELKPEQAKQIEASHHYHNDFFYSQISAFYRDIRDGIIAEYDTNGVGKYNNYEGYTVPGIQSAFNFSLLYDTSLDIQYTYQDARVTESDVAFIKPGSHVPSIFTHKFYAKFSYQPAHHLASLDYQYESGLYYHSANFNSAPPIESLNFQYQYSIADWLLHLSIHNILDKANYNHMYQPMPGRSFLASIKYTYQATP